MDANPYQPPRVSPAPAQHPSGWPVWIALPVGCLAWMLVNVAWALVLRAGLGDASVAPLLLSVPGLGAAAWIVGRRCRGGPVTQCVMLVAGAFVGALAAPSVAIAGVAALPGLAPLVDNYRAARWATRRLLGGLFFAPITGLPILVFAARDRSVRN